MLGTRSLGIWIPGRGIQYFHSKYRLPALLIWMTVCITFGMVVCAPLLNAVICYFTSGEWTDNVAQLGPIKLTFRLTDKATCENHPWWIRLLGWALSWARTCDANGDGEVDLGKFNAWLEPIVTEKGVDIYRMKGVIAIYGDPNKYVYHAVHMIFSGAYTDPWGDEERCCKLMFIGKNLDKEELERGFEACRVEGSAPKKQKTSA